MFSLCALVVFSADVSHILPVDKISLPLQWQTTLMDRFFFAEKESKSQK